MSDSRWSSGTSSKRSRPEDDDDDVISIVTRSPSPPTPDAMDVDDEVAKYDEYARGVPREVITVETKIKPTNIGFAMLTKLGWSDGQPLGISGDGRIDPIPFQIKRDLTGLGKTTQDFRMIETTVSQRRGLDSERQQKETEHQRRAREDLVARKSALESEISTTLKAFYCILCDKQFKTVAQYDEHTNSYAHHHKARFRDMQANVRLKPKEEVDKRKEKERKREEKELRKIAAANGIKMPKPTAASMPTDVSTPRTSMEVDSDPVLPRKAGWVSLSGTQGPIQPNPKPSWVSVDSVSVPPPFSEPSPPSTSPRKFPSTPAFRTAGWTSLDTAATDVEWSEASGSSQQPPSLSTDLTPAIPLSSPSSQTIPQGWQQFQRSGLKRR